MAVGDGDSGQRRRGRPPARVGTVVSRELIVERSLEIAGTEGFPAVTMHRLAREFGITPRALYNHVRDRQEVIDLTAARLLQLLPEPTFDADDWADSLRVAYRRGREAYRRHPRALLISLDEQLTPVAVDPKRILLAESMLQFFIQVGLDHQQAAAAHLAFLTDLFAFALMVDLPADAGPPALRSAVVAPVPAQWLDVHPDLEAPASRAAAAASETPDELFERLVDLRVAGVENQRRA